MARRAAAGKKKGNVLSIDFSGVESRGRFHEDGDYRLKVNAVAQEPGDKYPYLNWELSCVEGESEGAIVYNNTSLAPQSLWNVKAMLEALGEEVPDDEMDIDLDSLADVEFIGKIEMETYEGKPRPRLVDFWAADEKDEKPKRGAGKSKKDDEDEKPARGKAGKKAKASITEEDIGDMSQEELQDLIDTHKLDVDLDSIRTLRKMQAAVIDAAQEADILEEGDGGEPEDEPEEKPARRSRRGAAKDEDDGEEEEEKPARRSRRARR